MANSYFQFKQFRIDQEHCAMKVSSDACVFGAWGAAQLSQSQPAKKKILDIGAGTGLLSLMLAQSNQEAEIFGIEIDKRAADQAKQNVSASPWPNRIEIIQGDIKSFVPNKKFDAVVSNPPFYEGDLQSPDVQKNWAYHDSSLRFNELISSIERTLSAEGLFLLLLPAKKMEQRLEMISEFDLHVHKKAYLHHDAKHHAIRVIILGGRKKNPDVIEERIELFCENGQYTEQVKTLLRDFYLAF